MPVLEHARVFEVDHPATQSFKRARVGDRDPPTEVRYVSVDFEREAFADALRREGHDASRPTVWIWEGVAMYLPEPVVLDSLAQMTALSAESSWLLMTYRTPGGLPLGPLGEVVVPMVFAAGGEPLGATMRPEALEAALAPDWRVAFDADAFGWMQFAHAPTNPARGFRSERFAAARRER